MGILSELQPASVFNYFEQICGIPHGSSHTEKISDYIENFAKEQKLDYKRDEVGNCIIYKKAALGYESKETVILQGHLDMVCEKEDDCEIDFEHEGLHLQVEDGVITAKGTTLGGDDGIAVAYMLAILSDNSIKHPALECVFTVDEEIGMLGAAVFDMSLIHGRAMINLDSEEEGHFLVSCAGGVTSTVHLPFERESEEKEAYAITVAGLEGGHSGAEIDKGRANANMVMGRVLNHMKKADRTLRIVEINGGLKDNAIPRKSQAVVTVDSMQSLENVADKFNQILANEFKVTDKNIHIVVEKQCKKQIPMDEKSTDRIIAALLNLPNGIQRMSFDMKGLVETSLNLGILKTEESFGEVRASFSVRSSVNSEKQELVEKLESLAGVLGGSVTNQGAYPAWEYRENSRLKDVMIEIYRKQYDSEPIVESMHAGVECGLFSGGLPGLDAVSIGPDLKDIHTPKESMDVESVRRVWEFVLEVLKSF